MLSGPQLEGPCQACCPARVTGRSGGPVMLLTIPGGIIVLIWDNLNVHLRTELRDFTGAQAWLQVFRLPAYAPDLNPVEGIWSVLSAACWPTLPSPASATWSRSSGTA